MNQKRIPLGDVLRLAVSKYLHNGSGDYLGAETDFTCIAIRYAANELFGHELLFGEARQYVAQALKDCGADPNGGAFSYTSSGPSRQGARAMWLTLLALEADDLGLEVTS